MSLSVLFLGTSGAVPTTQRNTSGIFLRREGDRFLFDCGEGIQRQMMRFGTGFDISHIFITHLHADHTLGVPGLIQTMDFNDRTEPLSLFVPRGTKHQFQTFIESAGSRPGFPLTITPVKPGSTALQTAEYRVETFETDHDTLSIGYAFIEADRKGRFDRKRAEELGVPVGPKFSTLHEGKPVTLDDGTIIEPEQVVGPPRPGRRVVYTGDTRPTENLTAVDVAVDLLIHDATFAADHAERAETTGHSTAADAARMANLIEAKRLALVHISSRYSMDVDPLAKEAGAVFSGPVIIPDDGDTIEIPYPDSMD